MNRCKNNPIIRKDQVKPSRENYEVVGVFNPAAIKYGDETLLLLRVAEKIVNNREDTVMCAIYIENTNNIEELIYEKADNSIDLSDARIICSKNQKHLTSISHLRIARSADGVNFIVDEFPAIVASNKYESFGIEDPRITYIDDKYYIVYDSASEYGINVSLVSTNDFKTFINEGIIFCSDNKDVVIFPEKINEKYYALHRPSGSVFGKPDIWIAESKDLKCWGNHKILLGTNENSWSGGKVGAGAVPFKTKKGWVEIYHGATSHNTYCLGAMLLDLEKPWIVLANSAVPLVEPVMSYETEGFFGNVVFTCGAILEKDMVHIYYGAADDSVALIDITIDEIFRNMNVE